MDSNMKLSHLSFRNHCIFRSLNNFSSEGQFLRPINGGAIFLFFSLPLPPPVSSIIIFFDRLALANSKSIQSILLKFLIEGIEN